ncbi:MAG: mechanosensitive ion channel family protein [Cyanobacteria bacterium J06559_3]
MNTLLLQESWFVWGLGLFLLFPLVMVLTNELTLRVKQQSPEVAKVLQEVRNLILPTLALLILLTQVLELDSNRTDLRVVQTLFWVSLIHASLALVNTLLFTGARPNTWQDAIPKILRDLIRVMLILVGITIVLSAVWKADLGRLITALGVSSIVLGLALQDTLGNLFSGVALLVERPFDVGDWLEVGDNIGKVAEINWRSVHLVTRERELLIVPSSILARDVIRNYRRPLKLHVEPVIIGFSYDDPPNKVKRVLIGAALETEGILNQPTPEVQTISYDDFAITYKVRLYLPNYENVPRIRDEFMTRIWYAARRNNLTIPFPIRTVYHHDVPPTNPDEVVAKLGSYLRSLPSFAAISHDILEELACNATFEHFGRGEVVLHQGEQQVQPHFVLAGRGKILFKDKTGVVHETVDLRRGDFFGADALLSNQQSVTSVVAVDDLEVIAIATNTFQEILDQTPRLARELGAIISARRQALYHLEHPPEPSSNNGVAFLR